MLRRVLVILVLSFMFMLSSSVKAMDNISFGDGYVYDGANMIRYTEKKLLNLYLKDLRAKTTAGLAVVTLPTLEGQRAEDRAMHIYKAFRIGGFGMDNGAVIVVSPMDNKIAIYTGYNIDEAIPDIRKKQIIEDIMLPAFKNQFYTKGLYDGAVVCILDIANYYNKTITGLEYKEVPPMPKTFIQKITPLNWFIAILLLVAGIICYFLTKKPEINSYMGFGGDFKDFDEW